MTAIDAIAIVPVRDGLLSIGAAEVVAEAGGSCWLIGDGCNAAVDQLEVGVERLFCTEIGIVDASRWAEVLALHIAEDTHVILPHSPDGRDLAPHLAARLDRALVAGAIEVSADRAIVVRHGGLAMNTLALSSPVVATLQLGIRSVEASHPPRRPEPEQRQPTADTEPAGHPVVESIELLPPNPATMDLAEAPRIVGGGAGLGSEEHFAVLRDVADALGASAGATRVVTDWGWMSADRQIGTTGVMVNPDLYIAVGISGAIQHSAGLGQPTHIISVNTDPSCPMMELADVAIVCDGPSFVADLLAQLPAVHQP